MSIKLKVSLILILIALLVPSIAIAQIGWFRRNPKLAALEVRIEAQDQEIADLKVALQDIQTSQTELNTKVEQYVLAIGTIKLSAIDYLDGRKDYFQNMMNVPEIRRKWYTHMVEGELWTWDDEYSQWLANQLALVSNWYDVLTTE